MLVYHLQEAHRKTQSTSKKKKKNLVKEKKNQNEFRLNDFRNKKKKFLMISIHDLIRRKIFLIRIKNSLLAFNI